MVRLAALAFMASSLCVSSAFAAAANVQPRGEHPTHPSPSRTVKDFIVMGDSYSDSCNVYNAGYFNPGMKPPNVTTTFPHCPPAPTGRADQGRSWPEWIRRDQGQKITSSSPPGGMPYKSGQWNITNLAQSGATCDNEIFPRAPIPDIGGQTTLYQNNYNMTEYHAKIQTDPDTTWLAMFIGTNDVTLALNGSGTVSQETDCIEQRLVKLHTIGFRNFLMIENINLQDCPLLNTTQFRAGAEEMVNANNREQKALFNRLKGYWRDNTVIDVFPAYDLFSAFYNNPGEYGFNNVDGYCGTNCTNPGEYLWANTLHPSSRAFHIFARKVERYLSDGARGQSLINGAEGL